MSAAGGLDAALAARRALIESELERLLPASADDPGRLVEATRYGLLGPGKRLRGCIVTWTCEAVAPGTAVEPDTDVLLAAAAIECLHAYTLVHDDLPAMDDDDVRRGRATVHKAFDEATAILAGDALLTEAFALLARIEDPEVSRGCARALGRGAGLGGVLTGQARDLLLAPGAAVSLGDLERVHAEKTGALFAAAARMGAVCGGADPDTESRLHDYGMLLGIAFQHADDLDDADRPELAADARRRLGELTAKAKVRLDRLPKSEAVGLLAGLADQIVARHR